MKIHVVFEAPYHTSIISLFLDIPGNIVGKPMNFVLRVRDEVDVTRWVDVG